MNRISLCLNVDIKVNLNYPDKRLLHSHIHEYGHVRNGHIMFITIEHIMNIGISKFENT